MPRSALRRGGGADEALEGGEAKAAEGDLVNDVEMEEVAKLAALGLKAVVGSSQPTQGPSGGEGRPDDHPVDVSGGEHCYPQALIDGQGRKGP